MKKQLLFLLVVCYSFTNYSQITLLKDFYKGDKDGVSFIHKIYKDKLYISASEEKIVSGISFGEQKVFSYDGADFEVIADADGNLANFLGAYFPENDTDLMIVNVTLDRRARAHVFDGTTLTKISDSQYYGGGIKYKDKYYFTGFITGGKYPLFYTDGTEAGTGNLNENAKTQINFFISERAVVNNSLVFAADTAENGTELWVTDGTEAGTKLLKDINPGDKDSKPEDFFLTNDKKLLYFTATTPETGREVWVTDGTEEGTKMLKDFGEGTRGDDYDGIIEINGKVYFGSHNDLWVSDGTPENTIMIYDGTPKGFLNFKNQLFFVADKSWYKSDGTLGGTLKVTPNDVGVEWRSFPAVYKDEIYFSGSKLDRNGQIEKPELWKTDGTSEGTVLVKEINPDDTIGAFPSFFKIFQGELFFAAVKKENSVRPQRLWKTDGTEAGTVQIPYDIEGAGFFTLAPGTIFKDQMLFVLNTNNNLGKELYVYKDGATASVTDIELSNINVFYNSNTLHIKGLEAKKSTLKVYNILGKTLKEVNFTSNGNASIGLQIKPGIYIATIRTEQGKFLSKKFVVGN